MSALTVLAGLVDPQRVPALTAMCESLLPEHAEVSWDGKAGEESATKESETTAIEPTTPSRQNLALRKQSTASMISPLNLSSTPNRGGTANSWSAGSPPGSAGTATASVSPQNTTGIVATAVSGAVAATGATSPPRNSRALGDAPEEPHLKAMHLVAQANQLLDGGLHRCKEWVTVKDMYYNAAAHFSACDMHQQAGDTFNHSAAICRVYGSQLEVANAASYAVESYRLADPMQCNPLFEELIEIYTTQNRGGLVAKYQMELAKNCEQLAMLPEALQYYGEALASYERCSATERGQAGGSKGGIKQQCKLKTVRISATLGDFKGAALILETLAKDVVTRGLGPTQHYFHATLCWYAYSSGERFAGGLAKTKKCFDEYQDLDPNFQKGVECLLIKSMIQSWDKPSLAAFDDAVRTYHAMRPKEEWVEMLIAKIRDNLFQYLLPFM